MGVGCKAGSPSHATGQPFWQGARTQSQRLGVGETGSRTGAGKGALPTSVCDTRVEIVVRLLDDNIKLQSKTVTGGSEHPRGGTGSSNVLLRPKRLRRPRLC